MKTLTTETLIVGAGPAGLACAMELSKKGKSFIVIEKDSLPGGLSKTYSFKEADGSIFFTDNGPHRFFSKNPYLYEFIGSILGEDWIQVKRHTRQYIDGKFYYYPIHAIQALKNIGVIASCLMFTDYLFAKIKFRLFRKPIRNFREYIEAHFGKKLGEFNMINYTEKIWGIPAESIHQDWAKQRVKGLDLSTVILDLFKKFFNRKFVENTASLIDVFYYPRRGSGEIYEKIVALLVEKKYKIFFESTIISLTKVSNGFETEVLYKGEKYLIKSTFLVESVPITQFVRMIQPLPPQKVFDAVSKLTYRSQVYLFITLNKESLSKDQWIYLPNKEIPFGRISEMRNFSKEMSPAGKTSLFVEFFCTEGDRIWNTTKEELFESMMPCMEKMNLFLRGDVRNVYQIKQKNVYPVYDLLYKEHVSTVTSYLDSVENLFAVGRPGRFRYNNQDHSLEMGLMAAKSIIEKKRYDIDAIGNEDEYFEKGAVMVKVKN